MKTAIKVKVITKNDSSFEGLLHSKDDTTGKIILTKVTTKGVKLLGPQYFYNNDIAEIQSLDDATSEKKNDPEIFQRAKNTLYTKNIPSHISKLRKAQQNISLAYANRQQIVNADVCDDKYEDFIQTQEYLLINRICDKFKDAILEILQQLIVGLQLNGENIGRHGTISVLEVSAASQIFIFDIMRIGNIAFSEGLQKILESPNIVKVVHDCRFMADMFRNKYNISLNNVFDTQVAHAFVLRQTNGGSWPRYMDSLPICLLNHLEISYDQVHYFKIRETEREQEEVMWMHRPLSSKLLSAVSKNLTHVIELHNVLLNKMMVEYWTAVQISMHHVDILGGEVEKCRMEQHLLPIAFSDMQHYMNFFKDTLKKQFHNKFFGTNRFSPTKDKEISFSHDYFKRVSRTSRNRSCSASARLARDTRSRSCKSSEQRTFSNGRLNRNFPALRHHKDPMITCKSRSPSPPKLSCSTCSPMSYESSMTAVSPLPKPVFKLGQHKVSTGAGEKSDSGSDLSDYHWSHLAQVTSVNHLKQSLERHRNSLELNASSVSETNSLTVKFIHNIPVNSMEQFCEILKNMSADSEEIEDTFNDTGYTQTALTPPKLSNIYDELCGMLKKMSADSDENDSSNDTSANDSCSPSTLENNSHIQGTGSHLDDDVPHTGNKFLPKFDISKTVPAGMRLRAYETSTRKKQLVPREKNTPRLDQPIHSDATEHNDEEYCAIPMHYNLDRSKPMPLLAREMDDIELDCTTEEDDQQEKKLEPEELHKILKSVLPGHRNHPRKRLSPLRIPKKH